MSAAPSTHPTPAKTPVTPKTPAPATKQSPLKNLGTPRLAMLIVAIVLMVLSTVLTLLHKVDKKVAIIGCIAALVLAAIAVFFPAKKAKVE